MAGESSSSKSPNLAKEITSEASLEQQTSNDALSDSEATDKNAKDKTIILIGSTGKGKSTLANVLINKDNQFIEIFKESQASVSGTREIQEERFVENGINYQ